MIAGGLRRGSANSQAMIKRYQAAIEAERERLRKSAEEAVSGAAQGDVGALDRLIGMLPAGSQFRRNDPDGSSWLCVLPVRQTPCRICCRARWPA